MKRDDYILALTSGLLTVDDTAFDDALNYFKQFYEMQQPAKPGLVSLGGEDNNYIDWLKGLRAEGITSLHCYWYFEQTHASMPAHIEAAFAGSQSLVMQVTTGKRVVTYRLRTLFSPQYEMTPQQFIQLIDAQERKADIWRRVVEVVNESNGLNDNPIIAPDDIARYLQEEGREVYNFLVSQIVQEVQVECEVLQTPFVIPDPDLLHKSDFSFFGDGEEREHVYLYPTEKLTKEQILQLVAAQPFSNEVWAEVERSLSEWGSDAFPLTGWPGVMDSFNADTLQQAGHTVCRAIATLCEQRKLQPVVPDSLRNCIGPDEEDAKRANARSKISGGKGYYLQSIKQPWELYLFVPVDVEVVQPMTDDISKQFRSTLQEIAALAQRMQTPYAEAFLSAEFLLDPIPGNFDDEHEQNIATTMQQKGFSEQAIQIFKNHFSYLKDHHKLQWPAHKIFGLCAVSMADVFGGMGSWNDLNAGEDEAEYQRLSTGLFQIMKQYFANTISL